MSAANRQKKQVTRLENLEVHEVSVVDRPANGRPFLMVKSAEQKGAEVVTSEDGNHVTREEQLLDAPPAAPDFQVLKGVDDAIAELVAKAISVPEELKGEAFKAMRQVMQRIDTAMMVVSSADSSDNGSDTFMDIVSAELAEIGKIVGDMSKRFGRRAKKNDGDPEPTLTPGSVKEIVDKTEPQMPDDNIAKDLDAIAESLEDKPEPAPEPTNVEKQIAELQAANAALGEKVEKQAEELKQLRDARPAPASRPVEGAVTKTEDEDEFWPLDLNEPFDKESTDKEVSFYE